MCDVVNFAPNPFVPVVCNLHLRQFWIKFQRLHNIKVKEKILPIKQFQLSLVPLNNVGYIPSASLSSFYPDGFSS